MADDAHGADNHTAHNISGFYSTVVIQGAACFIIYLLIRYRFQVAEPKTIRLKKDTVNKLIREYRSAPLPEIAAGEKDSPDSPLVHDFASHDVFRLGGCFKKEVGAVIKEYGIGTCGPRGFYGSLDIHGALEEKLAKHFKKEACVLYSNGFAGLQSVVSCFCRSKNTVYFQKDASEAILRGLYNTKAATLAFDDLDDLERQLDPAVTDKYIVIERLGKNTGQLTDLKRLASIKVKYGCRVILDESYSSPLLYNTIDPELYMPIDVVTGSLCHGYPGSGGFACGSIEVSDYQRLSAQSYVFSASLPAYLTMAAICFLDAKFDYDKLKERITAAHRIIPGIVSTPESPVLLVAVADAKKARMILRENGYSSGINGKYLRICVNLESEDTHFKHIASLL